MSPYSLSGTTYNLYEDGDDRYPGGGRYADGDRYAGGRYPGVDRYPEDRRYQDDDRYVDHLRYQDDSRYPDDRGWPRQQTRQKPRPTHRRNPHKERPAQIYVEYSSRNSDDESDQNVKEPIRKKKVAPLEKIAVKDEFKARFEEMIRQRDAENEKRAADEKKEEDERLAVEKKADEAVNAKIHEALADQREAFEKEVSAKELATKNELERLQGERLRTAAAVKNAIAEKAEADRQAAADRMHALREKAEADKAAAERWKATVAQEAEKLFAQRIKQQANDLEAEDRAQRDMIEAENRAKLYMMLQKLSTEYDSINEKMAPSKKPVSKKVPREKNTPKKTATPGETGIPHWLEDNMPTIKELVGVASKDDALGHGAAFLQDEADSEGDTETDPLRIEAPSGKRGPKSNVERRKGGKALREGKSDGKATGRTEGEEGHGEYKDGCNKKGVSKIRKPALYAMRWFAGKSYI